MSAGKPTPARTISLAYVWRLCRALKFQRPIIGISATASRHSFRALLGTLKG
jgi:hypothetical protein